MKHSLLAKRILVFFFAPCLILVALFVAFKDDTRTEDPVEVVSPENDTKIVFQEKSITKKEKLYEVNISYPDISGISVGIDSLITNHIRMKVESMAETFTQRESSSEYSFSDVKSTLEIDYTEVPPTRGILSIPLLVSEYASGAAHPNSFMVVLHYDVQTGKPLVLADLFSRSDFLSDISALARAGLENQFTENGWEKSEWSDEGTVPLDENYREFYIENDSMVIIFNPYQVAPYVYGIIEVPIPLSELASILKPAYR